MKRRKKLNFNLPDRLKSWNGILVNGDIWIDKLMRFELETTLEFEKATKIQRNDTKDRNS